MPKEVAFISSKFGIDPCSHNQNSLNTKNANRQTAFQLHTVDLWDLNIELQAYGEFSNE